MSFNRSEQEAIILNAAWSMIDDMVNFAIFMPLRGETENTNLMPQTADTRRLFQILLGDFLSPLVSRGRADLPFGMTKPDQDGALTDFTFLFYLRQVAGDPKLGASSDALRQSIEEFANWLEGESYVEKVWLPSIEVEVDLTISRITWLKLLW